MRGQRGASGAARRGTAWRGVASSSHESEGICWSVGVRWFARSFVRLFVWSVICSNVAMCRCLPKVHAPLPESVSLFIRHPILKALNRRNERAEHEATRTKPNLPSYKRERGERRKRGRGRGRGEERESEV